jgi:diacylglycerol kinase family enzyme
MLREQRLQLPNADAGPVLDPALRQVVLDVVEAAIVHAANDRDSVPWVHGPNGPSWGPPRPIAMQRFLIVNPRSGTASPTADDLRDAARARGIQVHFLQDGEELEQLARSADAAVLGMAGGDGSLGAVAAIALERDLPFVCIPFGTRNHFARDIGLDRDDPIGALDAFEGVERRIDVGWVDERLFLNNVSLGLYALLVHRRERHRRRRDVLARARALLLVAREHRGKDQFVLDGDLVAARVVVVACNAYMLDLFSIGERERMDEGLLHVYVPQGFRRIEWTDRSCTSLTIETSSPSLRAAIDGEPARLGSPVQFRVGPGALRVLVPRGPE